MGIFSLSQIIGSVRIDASIYDRFCNVMKRWLSELAVYAAQPMTIPLPFAFAQMEGQLLDRGDILSLREMTFRVFMNVL